jgi:hypothetical protein
MPRLDLPSVTLCAATSVNVEATIAAIEASTSRVRFGEVVLFTDSVQQQAPDEVRFVPIAPLRSSADYSNFLLTRLADHVRTDHCLIVQWDGFVLDPGQWDPAFLGFDYIGAVWPQFDDGHDVGNGGFSLRSRRLLEACRSPEFVRSHPEDVAICRTNRPLLERQFGIRFADRDTAQRFSFERSRECDETFGFHGVFNMIPLLGTERFWEIYRSLDDRTVVRRDLWHILGQIQGPKSASRRLRLVIDAIRGTTARQPVSHRRAIQLPDPDPGRSTADTARTREARGPRNRSSSTRQTTDRHS